MDIIICDESEKVYYDEGESIEINLMLKKYKKKGKLLICSTKLQHDSFWDKYIGERYGKR